MLMTTLLTFFVVRYGWNYPWLVAVGATSLFLAIDVALFASTSLKIVSGGWFTLFISVIMVTIMLTWRKGRELSLDNLKSHLIPLPEFFKSLLDTSLRRVSGTAVFFRTEGDGVPHAMLRNFASQ